MSQSKSIMDADTAKEETATAIDGRFSFKEIYRYLSVKSYPDGYSKTDKSALRKRANFFVHKGSDLYYVGGSSRKENTEPRLVIEDAARSLVYYTIV